MSKSQTETLSEDALREEIVRLGPWHLEVEVTPNLTTEVGRPQAIEGDPDSQISFVQHRERWQEQMRAVYPDGFDGRSFLDCACNAGGYSFWAKELGASRCFGFDVREHWIEQAQFLKTNRTEPSDGVEFAQCDLYDLPDQIGDEEFDVTIFKGIFYHLPDPVSGLQIAADRTRELLIVNTATLANSPDGFLAVAKEPVEPVMSGVYGLNWLPTGPMVLERILKYMGFPATRLVSWRRKGRGARGRLELMAARDPDLFKNYDTVRPPRPAQQKRGQRAGRGR